MSKLLNLDAVAEEVVREVQIKDKKYVVSDMNVGLFIEVTQAAEEMEKEKSVAKQMIRTRDLVKKSIPTLEEEVINSLSLEKLQLLVAFARGADPEDLMKAVDELAAEAAGEGGGQGK